ALRNWLRRVRLDPEQTLNVLVAAGEAVANAIEHGHRHSPQGTIRLGASWLTSAGKFSSSGAGCRYSSNTTSS
uniref:ATP-binding protein n=1 Tax=Mycobacterium avium TaxID=1764 RepID=UPI000A43B537